MAIEMTSPLILAPYIPSTDIVKVIENFPNLPDIVSFGSLTRDGMISRGNASSVVKALIFLSLTTADGHPTQALRNLSRIPRASRDYVTIWRKILQDSYPALFAKIGPTGITEDTLHITRPEINNMFVLTDKRTRMGALFVGLAREAGWSILSEENGNAMQQTSFISTQTQTDEKSNGSSASNADSPAISLDKATVRTVFDDLLNSLELLRQLGEDLSLSEKSRRLLNEIQRINIASTQRIYSTIK